MTIISVAIGVLLASVTMPWSTPAFWLALSAGTAITGLIAGSYPAFFLSAFEPIKVLKGSLTRKSEHGTLRNALVVFQFTASIVLIVATVIMYKQINFIQNKQLGYNQEQVIILQNAYALGDRTEAYKEQMLTNPAVTKASISSFLPIPSNRSSNVFTKIREIRDDVSVTMQDWRADYDYLETFDMKMVEGRFFDPAYATDSAAIVLNQSAVARFGFANPIGQKVYTIRGFIDDVPTPEDFTELTVIGVIEDFHYESLRNNIGALGFQLQRSTGSIALRYAVAQSTSVISDMQRYWTEMAPRQPFSYKFLDDSFGAMYRSEKRVGQIALLFAVLAILISCLGLFGLANFTAEQRTKEIGIRKVLGASVAGIIGLLAKDFLKLVIIAMVIGSPIAWYFMQNWLNSFAYRLDMQVWVFVLAGGITIAIAFTTVSS